MSYLLKANELVHETVRQIEVQLTPLPHWGRTRKQLNVHQQRIINILLYIMTMTY